MARARAARGLDVARTGVTAIVPSAPESLVREPVVAGGAVLDGAGEMSSFLEIAERGLIETPTYLTSMHAVGRVDSADACPDAG